jgi:outer membrane protein assembly factor BamB
MRPAAAAIAALFVLFASAPSARRTAPGVHPERQAVQGARSHAPSARDWPQFRGPTGQGLSDDDRVPLEWSDASNVIWRVPVPGRGWSSPVVAGGRIWVTSAVETNGAALLRVLAYDVETGRELVDTEVFKIWKDQFSTNPKNSDASPTPVVEGDRVYVHFGASGTAALSTSGEVLWKTRLYYESQHGQGGSPVVYGDLLIVNCDGFDNAFVVALDRHTGRTKWRRARRQPWSQAYSTPLVIRVGESDQLVSVGAFYTTALDPLTGRELWRVGYRDGFSNVPRPVFGHGLVFITTGFQQPSLLAVRADGKNDVTRTHVAWTLARGAPYTPSPILVGDELYVVSDIGIATCLDARTGSTHWVARLGGNYSASPVFAAGRLYFTSEEGVTSVLAPGTTFTRLATNTIDAPTLASLAVSDGSFVLRTDRHMYRIGERQTVITR